MEARQVPKMMLTAWERSNPSEAFGIRIADLLGADVAINQSSSMLPHPTKDSRDSARERMIDQARLVRSQLGAIACSEAKSVTFYKKRKAKDQLGYAPKRVYSSLQLSPKLEKRNARSIFRFEDLPAELRDLICGYYFAQFNEEQSSARPNLLQALKINKILYAPAKNVYLKENEFHFGVGNGWSNKFLDDLDFKKLEMVRKGRAIFGPIVRYIPMISKSTIALCKNLTHLTLSIHSTGSKSTLNSDLAASLSSRFRLQLHKFIYTFLPFHTKLHHISLILEFPRGKYRCAYRDRCTPAAFFKHFVECRMMLDYSLGSVGKLVRTAENEREKREKATKVDEQAQSSLRAPRSFMNSGAATKSKEENRQVWTWDARDMERQEGADTVFKLVASKKHLRFD